MEDLLKSWGWYYIGDCNCSPKKYKYKHDTHPAYTVRVIRTMSMFQVKLRNHIIAEAGAGALQTTLTANGIL